MSIRGGPSEGKLILNPKNKIAGPRTNPYSHIFMRIRGGPSEGKLILNQSGVIRPLVTPFSTIL